MAVFTEYYKKAVQAMLDYFDRKQEIAVKVKNIGDNCVTIDIGISDGNEFILILGTATLKINDTVHLASDNIYCDTKELIKMNYIDTPSTVDTSLIKIGE